ncbi:MAG TPA: MFS transporter [Candidatus Saccharimonadales bacterium]|nr:MFS transporter [Candidatus Saccharimonadales bacterium]
MKNLVRSHWMILVLLALAQFMVVLDSAIVNVALPALQHSFHLSPANLQWIVTAYTLAFGGFLLLGGRAADLYGRRKIFLAGVVVFAIVSLLDGLAVNSGMLISLRALQGLAGAFMSPAALSIVLITYKEGHERNIALSIWGAVAAGGAAVGVLLGGILTQYLGWRWNFFINVPVAIAVLAGAWKLVPKHESEETHNDLDLPGAVSVTAGLMLLVYGLVKAPTVGWTAHSTLGFLAGALALLVFFIVNEKRTKNPLMPLSIFKIRNITGANLTQMPIAAALFAIFYFTSIYIQEILHFSPVRTGFAFLPVPITIAIAATSAPKLVKKVGYKKILMVAPWIIALGLFILGHVPVQGSYFRYVLPGLVVMAVGAGFTFVSTTIAATSGVPGREAGLASGLINTAQQLGGALGLAILSGVAAASTTHFAAHSGQPVPALVHGFHTAYYTAACFAIASALVATFIIKQKAVAADSGEPAPTAHAL